MSTTQRGSSPASDIRYVNDVQERLVRAVEELQRTTQQLALTVRTVEAQMPTRADIQTEIGKRLLTDTYQISHTALEREVRENHQEFERYVLRAQGGWQRAAPWVAIGVSVVFGGVAGTIAAISALTGVAGVIVAIFALMR